MSKATDQLTDVLNECIREREKLRELNAELRKMLRNAQDVLRMYGDREVGGLAWRIGELVDKAEKLK